MDCGSNPAFRVLSLVIERSAGVTLRSAAALYIGSWQSADGSYATNVVHWSKGRRGRPGVESFVVLEFGAFPFAFRLVAHELCDFGADGPNIGLSLIHI